MATLLYADGEIGEDILTEQTISTVPQIKFLIHLKINKSKGKKMKAFPVLTIIYKTTPCRN